MKKICLLTVLIMTLSACSGILENEFRASSPHAEASSEPLPEDGQLRAGTYTELKNAVLRLVKAGSPEGAVRLHNYVGDASRDVPAVCREVSRAEPIGVYALDFISYEITPIITDYDVALSLTYRRSHEQVLSVKYISGPAEFQEYLTEVVTTFTPGITFETNLYSAEQYDFAEMISDIYYNNPLTAQGLPVVSVSLYPDTGLRRVVELELSYPDTQETLKQQSLLCGQAAEKIISGLTDTMTTPEKALALYDSLGEICEFDFELYGSLPEGHGSVATAYDALYGERALPEAYALAYKLLCDMAGIPCMIVLDRRGADEHAWNLIQLGEFWYHADLAADDMGETLTHDYFLKGDSFMQADYRWDTQSFPAAEEGPLTYEEITREKEMI